MSRYTTLFKIVILGDSSVGKTSLLQQYITKTFAEQTKSTVGADFITREIDIDGKIIALQIWDTAGSERFCSLGPVFFRGADCCILVCDVTNESTFEHLDDWKKQLFQSLSFEDLTNFPFVVVGNKSDCSDEERQVSFEKLSHWGDGKYIYFECSAKTGWNIDNIFIEIATLLKEKQKINFSMNEAIEPCRLEDVSNIKVKKDCC
ncbi:hypothetical protein ENUP19_0380G0056 [Entamoeba nuttalli]|uniref:Rab family GTPase n=1 Tax=Entamoeba nuttalli TaxID=412467 RepID=A0ABQ0DZN3_9EUKA